MYSNLVVLCEAADGRDEELNDWYTWVHIRDVMRLSDAVVAAQRFSRSDAQLPHGSSGKYMQRYLALYETSNPARMTSDHAPVFTDEMPISDAYSYSNMCEAYYDVAVSRDNTGGKNIKTDVIVERIEKGAAGAGFAAWYMDARFPFLMKLPGVAAGIAGAASTHQLFEHGDHSEYTAVYRTTDLAATLKAWAACGAQSPTPLKPSDISVDCYTPLTERITTLEVRNPDAVSRETAARKRAALGDRLHLGPPAGITSFK
jgi:hypothetical protein